jgi:hypothetical protein
MAFGILGTCRGDELTNLNIENVTDSGNEIIVRIPDTKTKVPKVYIIDGEFKNIVREYMKLRPKNARTNRFFLQYRNGKLTNQVMGKHSIAKIPKEMAKFLKLPEPHTFTGHSYRRSGTTIAADAGASIEDLKRLGPWKSTSVCERYIQNSLGHRRKLAKLISGPINLPSTSITNATSCESINFPSTSTTNATSSESINLPSTSSSTTNSTATSNKIEGEKKNNATVFCLC